MNSRERLLITLKGNRADRIPISPFFYSNNVYEMFSFVPTIDNHLDPAEFDLAQRYVEYADYFGFDLLHPLGLRWDRYVPPSNENWDVKISEEDGDDERVTTTTVRTPAGTLNQAMRFKRNSKYLIVLAFDEYLIKTREDFEIFARYAPPANFIDCDMVGRAKEAVGDRGLANPATHGAFNTLNQFRKLEDLFMDPITDEHFYRSMMDWFLDWNADMLKRAVEAGADVLELGGNLVTSSAGPRFFKDFTLEYEQALMREVHDAGALVVYHNCGDAARIMHLYNDIDMDCWGYLTPPPFGDVDLDEALNIIRPDMALRGNIDQVEFMMKASPDEVTARVEEVAGTVKKRGNWILSTTDFFFDGTPYENIKAFAEAGRRFGKYE